MWRAIAENELLRRLFFCTLGKWHLKRAKEWRKLLGYSSVPGQFQVSSSSVSAQFPLSFCFLSAQFLLSFCSVFSQFLLSLCSFSTQFQLNFSSVSAQFSSNSAQIQLSFSSVSAQFLLSFMLVSFNILLRFNSSFFSFFTEKCCHFQWKIPFYGENPIFRDQNDLWEKSFWSPYSWRFQNSASGRNLIANIGKLLMS